MTNASGGTDLVVGAGVWADWLLPPSLLDRMDLISAVIVDEQLNDGWLGFPDQRDQV